MTCFAKDVIAFVNGHAPRLACEEGDEVAMVYGGGTRRFVKSSSSDGEKGLQTLIGLVA